MTPSSVPMADWLESAWLARYLDRQLAGDEQAWFEAYLLTRPKLLAMVETDTRLRDALAAEPVLVRPQAAEPVSAPAPVPLLARTDSAPAPRARNGRLRPAALAASAVIGLGAGLFGARALHPAADSAHVIASPMRVVFDTLRGAAPERPFVEHADSTARYALVEVAVPSSASRVAVQMGGRESALTPSADGFVSFLVERSLLAKDASAVVRYEVDGRPSQRQISFDFAAAPAGG